MIKNKEIEFKTFISKEKYEELLNEFDLTNNIFAQTNFYFDTEDTHLLKESTVLRIRQKGSSYKLTKKTRAAVGADETHLLISKEKALDMIQNGFDASIIGLPYFVKNIANLTTYRASGPYKDGTIFFDRSEYYNHVDYEIEYEVDEVKQGMKDFNEFLESHHIEYVESIRKSKRAFDHRND
ncbi:MAG: CYTH domain-containing protein [Anaeroplasmataceae bacterium]|nr:CYTH domain-containing protein [Anaeroplasmataceae bacterium]MDE5868464.1 CYTH domain-containing protein [Anaeroplasmataceae bacterium]MDE7100768.1 CYTH domain-containing protein [Anaeroplasmataceae bacterium]